MKTIKKILLIEIGTFIFAFSIGMFILPAKILSGGVAGISALLINYINIPADILNIILNTFLFVVGSIFLGKEFFFNTLVYSISYPFALLFVSRILPAYEVDPLLASIYGGLISGIGIGIIFRNGGSSGGTDAIALIVEKYFHIKVSMTMMIIDSITVLAGLYIYGLNNVLIGLISVFFMSIAIDRTMQFYLGIEAKKFEIISDKYQEIADDILKEAERGVTVLDGQGAYTGKEKKMLVVVVRQDEFMKIKEIIDKHDPTAFVVISDVKDVNGEGFSYEPRL